MAEARPNIVWIYCDELRTDALGCYGHPTARMKTPQIDRLAAGGVRFAHCFCNAPICVASRTSILTGLYPEQTGVYANEGSWKGFEMPVHPLTFPEVFAARGYATANFGKTHVHPDILHWQHDDPTGGGMKELASLVPPDDPSRIRSGRVPSVIGGRLPVTAEEYPANEVTSRALSWMSGQDGPYLARLSLLQPHTPVFPPPPFDRLYDHEPGLDGRIELRPNASAFERKFGEQIIAGQELTEEQVRWARIFYYGLVAWVDTQVARVIEFLEGRGQLDSTILVFESDHGAALGEGGRYAKHVFAPEVHRVPRIIHCPDRLPRGEVREDICQSLDLARTLFGLCGIDPPDPDDWPEHDGPPMQGRDLFAEPDPPEAVFGTIGHGEKESFAFPNAQAGRWDGKRGWPRRACLRTATYRFDRNVRINGRPAAKTLRDEFLCDWTKDPAEATNLAGDQRYQKVLADLSGKLDAHIARPTEPAAVPVK